MENNTHGIHTKFINDSTVFIDGIPDSCEHDDVGSGYYFISYTKEHGGGLVDMIPDTGQTQDEMIALDEQLRREGKYLSGGCVSCSKCGKPFSPPMF